MKVCMQGGGSNFGIVLTLPWLIPRTLVALVVWALGKLEPFYSLL